jgi:hypothetical protein
MTISNRAHLPTVFGLCELLCETVRRGNRSGERAQSVLGEPGRLRHARRQPWPSGTSRPGSGGARALSLSHTLPFETLVQVFIDPAQRKLILDGIPPGREEEPSRQPVARLPTHRLLEQPPAPLIP